MHSYDNSLIQEGDSAARKTGRYLIYTVTAAVIGSALYKPALEYFDKSADHDTKPPAVSALIIQRPENLHLATSTPNPDVAATNLMATGSPVQKATVQKSQGTDKQVADKVAIEKKPASSNPTKIQLSAQTPIETATDALATAESSNSQADAAIAAETTQSENSSPVTGKAVAEAETIVSEPILSWKQLKVKSGDSLSAVFERAGIGPNTWIPLSRIKEAKKHWASLRPGDVFDVALDEENNFAKLKYAISVTDTFVIEKDAEGYSTGIATTPVNNKTMTASGVIQDSFYMAALDAKMEDGLIMQLAELFGWDINFALDIRKGDSFAVVYEDQYQNGDRIGRGDILAAEFVNKGKVYRSVRFVDDSGRAQYFTPDGRSMRRAFLQSPVHFTRISSRFNPNRVHPIFKTVRPHRGVDYAARSGTKIKAAGDGYVHFIGRQRGYGKVVILKHAERYSTLYAHMRGFRKGLKKGSKVNQGDTIGYVGQTGAATGPHLHYEFRVAGKHKNPLTVKLPASQPIAKKYASAFNDSSTPLLEQLDAVSVHTQFALNNAQTATN